MHLTCFGLETVKRLVSVLEMEIRLLCEAAAAVLFVASGTF